MKEGFWPSILPDPASHSPTEETLGDFLPKSSYQDLYQLVADEGLPYFVRLNHEGMVELFLVFEHVEDFNESTSDAVSLEFKTYQEKLLAILWTLSDPANPLGFPISFDITNDESRFMALTMIAQSSIPIHYLAYIDQQIIHIYTEQITLSPQEKERVEGYIRLLFEADVPVDDEEHMIKESELQSIPATLLSDDVLQEKGSVYSFDERLLAEESDVEEAHALLMNTLYQAVLVMRRHAHSHVRESSFTIWATQVDGRIQLIVTPLLHQLFAEGTEEANPFNRFFTGIKGYLGTREERAIQLGAFPILRYQAGQLFHLELDDTTGQRLAGLYDHLVTDTEQKNPYRS